MIDFLCNLIHLIAVRFGLWDSPSLSALGENHKDYEAKITRVGVQWTKKTK